jgi:hypothetical protein
LGAVKVELQEMNKNTMTWLKVMWSIQIAVGIICIGLSIHDAYFKVPLSNFDATAMRTTWDLDIAIPNSIAGKNDLIDAISNEMVSLREQNAAFVSLIFICAPCMIIFSGVSLFVFKRET